MAKNEISDATNVLLEAARTAFNELHGDPALYRFSISGNTLECLHGTRKPPDSRNWPVTLRARREIKPVSHDQTC